jgi:hypothetical protein
MSSPEPLSPVSTPNSRNAIPQDSNTSSLVNTSLSSSSSLDKFTCAQIETMLKTKWDRYIIIENTGKHTSDCWSSFGFPAIVTRNGDRHRIEGFASCRKCFSTYSYHSNSTRWLNKHDCEASKERKKLSEANANLSTQRRLTSFFSAKPLSLKASEILKIKDLQAEWVCKNIRPFSIVEDNGLRRLIQECISIGKCLGVDIEEALCILSSKVLVMDRSMLITC